MTREEIVSYFVDLPGATIIFCPTDATSNLLRWTKFQTENLIVEISGKDIHIRSKLFQRPSIVISYLSFDLVTKEFLTILTTIEYQKV